MSEPSPTTRKRSNAISEPAPTTRKRSNAITERPLTTRKRSNAFSKPSQDGAPVDETDESATADEDDLFDFSFLETPDVDLDELALKVYPFIRRLLAIERERERGI